MDINERIRKMAKGKQKVLPAPPAPEVSKDNPPPGNAGAGTSQDAPAPTENELINANLRGKARR